MRRPSDGEIGDATAANSFRCSVVVTVYVLVPVVVSIQIAGSVVVFVLSN